MKKIKIFLTMSILLMMFVSCGNTVLYHGLSERGANEILVILEQNGIAGEKVLDETQKKIMLFNIVVAKSDKNQALEILKEKGLPRINPVGMNEMFSGSSLIPTITEEKAKYQIAMQGEIEKTLLQMQNVISARVHLVIPDADNVEQQNEPAIAKASVFLKYYQGLQQTPMFTEKDVQNIVAGAVLELTPGNVTVVLQRIQPVEVSQSSPKYTSFMFYNIAPESKKSMQITLVIILSVVFILLFAIVIMFLKIKDLKTSLSIIKTKK